MRKPATKKYEQLNIVSLPMPRFVWWPCERRKVSNSSNAAKGWFMLYTPNYRLVDRYNFTRFRCVTSTQAELLVALHFKPKNKWNSLRTVCYPYTPIRKRYGGRAIHGIWIALDKETLKAVSTFSQLLQEELDASTALRQFTVQQNPYKNRMQ